ncbi:MAG: ribonuclease D [Robiginitomaculum sp.]
MKIITTTDSLHKFCNKAQKAPYVVLDTEFMRECTFFSQLCLIQIATPNDEAIIDPLAKGIDLKALVKILMNKDIVKVLHAARQDMEIFYNLCSAVPAPIFDSQIAAMALGFGGSVSYMALVKGRLGINLDKGARFTNWAKRPLTEKQLNYALGDVTHLRDIYPGLVKDLDNKNHRVMVDEEMQTLMDENLYTFNPERAWMRLKPRNLKLEYLAVLKVSAAWREQEAIKKNVPRNRIIKDDGIYDIALRQPTSLKELGVLRGVPNGFENRRGVNRLIKAIKTVQTNAKIYAPKIRAPKHMPSNLAPAVDMLKTLLRLKAEYQNIASRMVATTKELEQIAAFKDKADVKALKGWRKELFGEDALAMLEGKLSLSFKDGKVIAVRTAS